jgi:hypothetical protein
MKAYLLTTVMIFALLTVLHVVHIVEDWQRRLTDPFYMALTVLAAAMGVWGVRLLRAAPRG